MVIETSILLLFSGQSSIHEGIAYTHVYPHNIYSSSTQTALTK